VMTARNCWIVHSAVGCSVTFQWRIQRADLEDEEDIEDPEPDGHCPEEVTGDDRVRMIPHNVAHRWERCPVGCINSDLGSFFGLGMTRIGAGA
jgi:hypothetical protein